MAHRNNHLEARADGACIVLLRTQGVRQKDISEQAGVSIGSVNRWLLHH